ncbi:MAG: AEC family transporter, partial [Oscillospiraceae bacterium]|nr:AEC family transporter [Oscillospiraceae bacterium]
MIVTLLIRKILSMFLMMFFGALLVRLKLLKAEDSRVLSALTIYLVIPCLILSSFQIEYSSELRDGLLLSVGGAVIVNVLLILLAWLVCRFYRLDPVEKNSAIYSNAGNLLIPLISSVLGSEWVIYSCIYMTVQMFLLFSHGKSVLCEERHVDLRGIFRNVNIITMFAGVLMLIFHIKLPPLVKDFCDSVSAMTGPLAMIITGMLIGGMGLRQVFRYRRI